MDKPENIPDDIDHIDVSEYRREQIRRTWRCFVWSLALVGAAAVISGAVRYFSGAAA